MTRTMLLYKNIAPVNKKRHAEWGIVSSDRFEFARGTNSVPLTAVEFPGAAQEFAIVFTKNDEGVLPIAVMGVRSQENLYIDAEGKWTGRYIPAFIRRYPFVFSTADKGETLTLCIDEDYDGVSPEGKGEKLFEGEKNSPYLEKVLQFLREYQGHFRRTQMFCKKLEEHDLLEPMGAQFKGPDGQQGSLNGFFVVSREKLKALSAETLAALAKTDELELIYLHMHSMHNLRETIKKLPVAANN